MIKDSTVVTKTKIKNQLIKVVQILTENKNSLLDIPEKELLIEIIPYVHYKTNVSNFHDGQPSMTWHPFKYQEINPIWINSNLYWEKKIKTLPDLIKWKNDFSNLISKSDFKIEILLSIVLKEFILQSAGNINELTERLYQDLFKHNDLLIAKIHLIGMWTDSAKIQIDSKSTLRQPVDSDYDYKEYFPSRELFSNLALDRGSIILEIHGSFENQEQFNFYLKNLIFVLCIYGPGSVQAVKHDYFLRSLFPKYSIPVPKSTFLSCQLRYLISEFDKKKLQNLYKSMTKSYIPISTNPKERQAWLELAIERYIEAINEKYGFRKRVSYLIFACESLLLENESELKYRLSQRASLLLGFVGFDVTSVQKIFNKAYSIRSAFVHGSAPKNDFKNQSEIFKAMTKFVGVLITILLELNRTHHSKDKIIDNLNLSLIDTEKHLQLRSDIRKYKLKMKFSLHTFEL